mmetsp:Transcript_18765/g.33765  ORF Transcript_18765/g.33765 Transcript_18765/m.33765 type:complete len:272 (-) Transcript_18765:756-1571(-)
MLNVSQTRSSTRNDTQLPRAIDRVQSIFVPQLLILEFGLCRSSHLDPGNPSAQRGHALLALVPVEVRVGLLSLSSDLCDPRLHRLVLLPVRDDGSKLLSDDYPIARAEHFGRDGIEGDPHLLGDVGGAGGDGNVLEVGLASLSEARGANGHDVEHTAHFVNDQRRERVARDVFGDDEDRLLRLDKLFEQGDDFVDVVELGVGDEYAGGHELGDLTFLVLDEVGGDVAAVDGEALGEFDLVKEGLGFFDDGGAVLADLVEGLGDDATHVYGT